MNADYKKLLANALRQYKHNNGDDGFVFGYDADEAESLFSGLQQEIEALRAKLRQYEEAEKQEPVGEKRISRVNYPKEASFAYIKWDESAFDALPEGARFYTHPAPIPEGYVLVPKGLHESQEGVIAVLFKYIDRMNDPFPPNDSAERILKEFCEASHLPLERYMDANRDITAAEEGK